jgi:hypothetical protein
MWFCLPGSALFLDNFELPGSCCRMIRAFFRQPSGFLLPTCHGKYAGQFRFILSASEQNICHISTYLFTPQPKKCNPIESIRFIGQSDRNAANDAGRQTGADNLQLPDL